MSVSSLYIPLSIVILAGVLCNTPAPGQNVVFQPFTTTPIVESMDGAVGLATGDINGDGKLDMVVASEAGLVVLLGSGGGQFEPGNRLLTGHTCDSVVGADFDRDGRLDLATYSGKEHAIFVLKGSGDGGFGTPFVTSTQSAPPFHAVSGAMVAGDLNQDTIPDLAAVQGGGLCLFLGNGDGTFQPCAPVSTGTNPRDIALADFNGDGFPDLGVTNSVTSTISVLLGLGKGIFQPAKHIGVSSYGMGIAASDLDKDGKADLAVATQESVDILLGHGDGTFHRGASLTREDEPFSIAAGDVNGDGVPDLAVGTYYGRIAVFLGNGSGAFQVSDHLNADGDVPAITLADLNGDSKQDVVSASHSGSSAMFALGSGDGRFAGPAYFGDASLSFLRTADADNDGKPDLLVALPLRKSIFLLHRGADFVSFPAMTDYPVDAQFADFNRDGITDVVVATSRILMGTPGADLGCRLLFFPGRSSGGFGTAITTQIERCPTQQIRWDDVLYKPSIILAVGDFTGDSIPDVAVGNNATNTLQLYRGGGDGSFNRVSEAPEGVMLALAAADFDQDGITDVAVIHGAGEQYVNTVMIYRGSSSGEWKQGPILTGCDVPVTILAADLNADAKPDLAAGCRDPLYNESQIVTFMNRGGGVFHTAQTTPLMFSAAPLVAAADFDGDQRDDLIVLERGLSGSFGELLLSKGDGTFRGGGVLMRMPGPVGVTAASWDDDARPDVAFLSARLGTLEVVTNHLAPGSPGEVVPVSAASLVAGPLAPGSIVSIFGKGFSSTTETPATGLATLLAGVTVDLTDSLGQSWRAPLFFVSPTQVNMLVPSIGAGSAAVTLSRDGLIVGQALVQISPIAPGIFTANANGKGVAAAHALHVGPDGKQTQEAVFRCGTAPGSCTPAPIDLGPDADQVYLLLYATGVSNCYRPSVRIGGVDASVTGSQPQSQYPGLDQVNVLLPRQLAGMGEVDVELDACGRSANIVRINIK